MRKFAGIFELSGSEICVFAETKEEARKIALEHFIVRLEKEMKVVEIHAETERCDICQRTFTPSEMMERDGEKLCVYCYADKYGSVPISPDDIPF